MTNITESAPFSFEAAPENVLRILTRTDAGRRWQGDFRIVSSPDERSLILRPPIDHPEREGKLEMIEANIGIGQTPETLERAVQAIVSHTRHWPIHWMTLGGKIIRADSHHSQVGIQPEEVNTLRGLFLDKIKSAH